MITDIPDFPTFGWICKLNESRKFSGSIGTGKTGTFTVHTFHYHIWIKTVKDEKSETARKYLCADCCIKPPYGSGKDVFGQDEIQYEFSDYNVGLVKGWLLEHVYKWECIGQK